MYIKITNLIQEGGHVDYKGFDINLIKPSSAVYNFEANDCVLFYNGELVEHEDIHVIDEASYNEYYQTTLEISTSNSITPDEKIAHLKEQIESMQEALDFLLLGGM